MVGFQTKLKHGEQVRIFRTIPGLQNAEFARLGGLHRNTFLNSPKLLDATLRLKAKPRCALPARSPAARAMLNPPPSACWRARFAAAERRGEAIVPPPPTTAHGALLAHITGGHIETIDAGPLLVPADERQFRPVPAARAKASPSTRTAASSAAARPKTWREKARLSRPRARRSRTLDRGEPHGGRRRINSDRQSAEVRPAPRASMRHCRRHCGTCGGGTARSRALHRPTSVVAAPTAKMPAERSRESPASARCDKCRRARSAVRQARHAIRASRARHKHPQGRRHSAEEFPAAYKADGAPRGAASPDQTGKRFGLAGVPQQHRQARLGPARIRAAHSNQHREVAPRNLGARQGLPSARRRHRNGVLRSMQQGARAPDHGATPCP